MFSWYFPSLLTPTLFSGSLSCCSLISKVRDPIEASSLDVFSERHLTMVHCTGSHLLLKEGPMMKAGQVTDLWKQHNIINNHFIDFFLPVWFYIRLWTMQSLVPDHPGNGFQTVRWPEVKPNPNKFYNTISKADLSVNTDCSWRDSLLG